MAMWEQILVGIAAAAILFFFWPGAKKGIRTKSTGRKP